MTITAAIAKRAFFDMKKLHFNYHMELVYSEPALRCHYTLKCIPGDTCGQKVERLSIEVLPANPFCRGRDSFGNQMLYGSIEERHERFSCHVEGEVVTGLSFSGKEGLEDEPAIYRYPHGAAVAGEGLFSYARELFGDSGREAERACPIHPYEEAVCIMRRLHQDFRYEKHITDLKTTAEEAWRLQGGVCQDYAHILIALCRMRGIPARYAAGFMVGEGESHAWVEIFADGRWHGLDPANHLPVNEDYVRLGIGRDAADCALNKGVLLGGGLQGQHIAVAVRPDS